MDAETVPLAAYRNADFPPDEYSFSDEGVARDITGYSLFLHVREYGGAAVAAVEIGPSSPGADGVYIVNASTGTVRIQIAQATLAAIPKLTEAGEPDVYTYDLLAVDPGGFAEVWMEGAFIVMPGVAV